MSRLVIFETTCKLLWQRTRTYLFEKHIFATNVISSGVLLAAGDVIQQEIEYRRGLQKVHLDLPRLGKFLF